MAHLLKSSSIEVFKSVGLYLGDDHEMVGYSVSALQAENA